MAAALVARKLRQSSSYHLHRIDRSHRPTAPLELYRKEGCLPYLSGQSPRRPRGGAGYYDD